jgi:hypothetical protein
MNGPDATAGSTPTRQRSKGIAAPVTRDSHIETNSATPTQSETEKACAEADDRAKYLFRYHFLCRLRKIDGIAPSKHNEEIQL